MEIFRDKIRLNQFKGSQDNPTRKFVLTDDCIKKHGVKLYRIKCIESFGKVEKGELGGYVEREDNLSQSGLAWVYDHAYVSGDAKVYGDARISGNACIENNRQYYDFDCFILGDNHVHVYLTKEKKIEIMCGGFCGDIEAFEKIVKETVYKNHLQEMLAIIKKRFGLDG